MIPLDELGDQHVSEMSIPAGKGVERVMRDGTRRRQRRRLAGLASFGVCVLAVGGLVVVAVRTGDRADTLVQVDAPRTNEETVTDVPNSEAIPSDVVLETDGLPVRDNTDLPLVPTPTLEGWTIQTTAVAVADRFNTDDAGSAVYSLTSQGSELVLGVSSGQADIIEEGVLLDRNGTSIDAALNRNARGDWTLTWNERPGINTGTTVSISGPDRTQLIDAASAIAFVDRPLDGALQPNFVPADPDLEPIFRGTTDGLDWSVGRTADSRTRVEIDGQSPVITTTTTRTSGPEISVTMISKDGVQITAIEVPGDAQSVSIISSGSEPIMLPISTLDDTGTQLAVAPIPAQRDAAVIAILFEDGTESTIGLPRIPERGWTTWQLLSSSR